MKNLTDLFIKLRRLDLNQLEVQDSLYRISDWLSDDEHSVDDKYIQNQLNFLDTLVKDAEEKDKFYITSSEKM